MPRRALKNLKNLGIYGLPNSKRTRLAKEQQQAKKKKKQEKLAESKGDSSSSVMQDVEGASNSMSQPLHPLPRQDTLNLPEPDGSSRDFATVEQGLPQRILDWCK